MSYLDPMAIFIATGRMGAVAPLIGDTVVRTFTNDLPTYAQLNAIF